MVNRYISLLWAITVLSLVIGGIAGIMGLATSSAADAALPLALSGALLPLAALAGVGALASSAIVLGLEDHSKRAEKAATKRNAAVSPPAE